MKHYVSATNIFLVISFLFISLLSGRAGAEETSLQYNLDVIYSGASPGGSAPWLTAVFDNNEVKEKDPNRVLLTMSAHNLTGSESIRMWCFNFTLPPKELTFSHVSGPAAVEIRKQSQSITGGGGYFDFQFVFADDEFNSGDTSVYEIIHTSPITSGNFSALSSPGGSRGIYGSAALIRDITGENKLSGWIGDRSQGKSSASGP